MVVSFFFESAPRGTAFGLAVVAIITTLLSIYIVYKTTGIFDSIIATSRCHISSMNIFSIMVLVFCLMTVAFFVGGIYAAIEFKNFMFVIYGILGAVFTFLLALYNSNPTKRGLLQNLMFRNSLFFVFSSYSSVNFFMSR